MNYTDNIYEKFAQAGGGRQMSQNVEQNFVNTEIWNLFRNRFKSSVTEASYWSDIMEFCRFTGKPFETAGKEDVERYYRIMEKRIGEGKISPLTVTKKFRELHSFAGFLEDEGCTGRKDYFYPYLKHMKKEDRLARSIPVEHMDALLSAASENLMCYTILSLMYRAGLSSTEITELNGPEDFAFQGKDVCVFLPEREEPCYIPEDVWEIVKEYMNQRENYPSFFYNRSGRRLNTMYISRMMKRYCSKAGIPSYSAEAVRNSCAFNLFAYGASPSQTAAQMGRTLQQIRRYRGAGYRDNLRKQANALVKVRIEKP